ncbi:MAG: BglII/BstYI family type II restriction endonuclease [Bacteroidetes bacterium]|nr:BglII/BstYI family type II restriction endonuclease [Bacteroidota bacterium]
MEIGGTYSHLNGMEYLLVHQPSVWEEIKEVISRMDAGAHKTKISKEQTMAGKKLHSPGSLNKAFKEAFYTRGWSERKIDFWVTDDAKLLRRIYQSPSGEQRKAIEAIGSEAIKSYNQTDFVKNRVAVEVQFGEYAFVAHDLFVKHMSFFTADEIDVGIEILPMKIMEREMSSGVPYYERDLLNIIRQGRGVPAVPLVLVGIKP